MDNASRDIILYICSFCDKKEILALRLLSKNFNRIISNYVYDKYYHGFWYIVMQICDLKVHSNNQDNPNPDNKFSINIFIEKMAKIKKLRITIGDIDENEFVPKLDFVHKLFGNIQTIKIDKPQSSYNFLAMFKSINKIQLSYPSTIRYLPNLPHIIHGKFYSSYYCEIPAKIDYGHIIASMPNLKQIDCYHLNINIKSIPKLESLSVHILECSKESVLENLISLTIKNIDTFKPSKFCDIYLFNKLIHMPNLKKIQLYGSNLSICNTEFIRFDPAKLEHIEIIDDSDECDYACATPFANVKNMLIKKILSKYPIDLYTSLKNIR